MHPPLDRNLRRTASHNSFIRQQLEALSNDDSLSIEQIQTFQETRERELDLRRLEIELDERELANQERRHTLGIQDSDMEDFEDET